jgi:ribonuclease P protein component
VRRRIREIVRSSESLVRAPGPASSGRDLLIVARPGSVEATYVELCTALRTLLDAVPLSTPDPMS